MILIVGVNGVGKRQPSWENRCKIEKEGKKVILGAGDTGCCGRTIGRMGKAFRDGAIKGKEGADPGSIVFDTLSKAEEIGADVAIIDTAGRLHNKGYLMKELEKSIMSF